MSFISENFGDAVEYDDDDYYRHPDINQESGICPACNGSGEGQNENQKCGQCKGHGII